MSVTEIVQGRQFVHAPSTFSLYSFSCNIPTIHLPPSTSNRQQPFAKRLFLTTSILAEMMHQAPWADGATTPKDDVHLGTWINWSRGPVMGATLTLNRREGNLLIAFTAVFVGIATERLWRIACMLVMLSQSEPFLISTLHINDTKQSTTGYFTDKTPPLSLKMDSITNSKRFYAILPVRYF